MNSSDVTITIIFSSPIEKVWQMWTDPAYIKRWIGSDPLGNVLDALLEIKTGGHFEITFADSDQTKHTCFGSYIEVEPLKKLFFTWNWKSEPGIESVVRIELFSIDSNTTMRFEHSNLEIESAHDYEKGWRSTFEKLKKVLNA